jgi:hypothetical protein
MNINIEKNEHDFPKEPREIVVQALVDYFLGGHGEYEPRHGRNVTYKDKETGKEKKVAFSPEEFNEALYACVKAGYHVFRGYYKDTYFYVKNNRDPRFVKYDEIIDDLVLKKAVSYT